MMTGSCKQDLQMACQQPEKSEAWNRLLITEGWRNKREERRNLKRLVWPQYLVEPQYIAGTFEKSQVLI
jgi:hypothetical protein